MNKLFRSFLPAAGVAIATTFAAPTYAQPAVPACVTTVMSTVFGGGFTCLDQDKLYSDFVFSTLPLSSDAAPDASPTKFQLSDTVSFTNNTLDQHQIVFNGGVIPAKVYQSGTISYKIKITDPLRYFLNIRVSDTSLDSVVTKKVTPLTGPLTDISRTISTEGPTQTSYTVADQVNFLQVLDTWTVAANGNLTSFNNVFRQSIEVPGPLPILGAGMAFGFSRKLRSRIKQRQAV